ncbi:MAG: carboxymuconolactone decarboxylase family protein [Proteobacteria bacterium]|nr:carboxymuconolactone decarboxylase family protein [Pseudomonadota bacterium]
MSRHTIYNAETADEVLHDTFLAVEEMVGFVPNVLGILGDVPNVFNALVALNTQFAEGQLSPIEREIVQLAVSVQNGCGYCVAGHSAFATELEMPKEEIAALRSDRSMSDPRHEALRKFSRTLAAGKGLGADAEYEAFLSAGYSTAQVRDVILGVSAKMFTNTLAILLELPADDAFKPFAWSPDEANTVAVSA